MNNLFNLSESQVRTAIIAAAIATTTIVLLGINALADHSQQLAVAAQATGMA